MLTVGEAIQTALQFEHSVRGVYEDAATRAADPVAKKTLLVLADEEHGHVQYLEERLAEWMRDGKVRSEVLPTVLPSAKVIQEGVKQLKARMRLPENERRESIETLKRAVEVEDQTSAFYRDMVGKLEGEGRRMFQRFLEIEDGHNAMVQAELDSVQGLGYWFDVEEFKLEAG